MNDCLTKGTLIQLKTGVEEFAMKSTNDRVPTQTGKPGKMGRGIFQSGKGQGILNRLEKSGKITQNTEKLWEFEINII